MMKVTEIVKRWKEHRIEPREDLSDVLKVLKYYKFEVRQGKGSHLISTHDKLDKLKSAELGLRCEFTIPAIKGRKVSKVYISRILKYIRLLEESNEER